MGPSIRSTVSAHVRRGWLSTVWSVSCQQSCRVIHKASAGPGTAAAPPSTLGRMNTKDVHRASFGRTSMPGAAPHRDESPGADAQRAIPAAAESPNAQRFILVAVADPAAHPEAVHVAAATGRPVVDVSAKEDSADDLMRHFPRAAAVLIDAEFASALDELARAEEFDARGGVFAVAPDPGPAVAAAVGRSVYPAFAVPAQAPELLARLGEALRAPARVTRSTPAGQQPRRQGRVLACAGACGGSGASTIAAAVAKRAAGATNEVVLIDAVANSGGIDLLLGCEDRPGARWEDVDFSNGDVPGADLVNALPRADDGVAILAGQRSLLGKTQQVDGLALKHAIKALRGAVDLIVVDVPCHGDLLAAGTDVCDMVVIVVPAEVRPTAAATRLCADLARRHTATRVLVRHRAWSSLTVRDIEGLVKTPVLGELVTIRGLARVAELGGMTRVPQGLTRIADAVLSELGQAA